MVWIEVSDLVDHLIPECGDLEGYALTSCERTRIKNDSELKEAGIVEQWWNYSH